MPNPISGTYIDPDNVGTDLVGTARSVTDNANRTFAGTTNLTGAVQINGTTVIAAAETVGRLPIIEKVTLGNTGAAAGDIMAWANPTGGTIFASLIVDITTKSTGASTCDFGVAADGTTSSDTLLDGIDTGTAAAVWRSDDASDQGTNGISWQKLTSSQYITGSEKTGDTVGLVGSAYVIYYRA